MNRGDWLEYTLLIGLGLLAGGILPNQAGINAQLARRLGHPVLATCASFLIGSVVLLTYCLTLRYPLPSLDELRGFPLWVWAGGLLGIIYLISVIILARRMGAAATVSLVVCGQLLTSIVLDHFGLVGFPVRLITPGRIGGAVLLAGGVVLILRS